MRFLSLALLALALAAATAYVNRKEYIYDYETLTVTGIPTVANQVTGLKIKCRIRAQFLEDAKVMLKVETAELLKINDVLPTLTLTENEEAIPAHLFTELEGPEVEEILAQLYKPVLIGYDGVVSELLVDALEPEWSINIKRGFISILNLNLRETDAILEDVPAAVRDRYLLANWPLTEEPARLLYRAMETDPVGECESIYALTERTEGVPVPVLNLTKIRNYDSCLMKPILKTGLMATIDAATAKMEKKLPMETTNHVDYQLTGTRERFVIQKAYLHSEVVYMPLGEDMGEAVATIRSKLELFDTEPIREPIRRPTNMKETLPLLTQLPITTSLPTAAHTEPTATATRVQLLETLVSETITLTEPYIDITVPEKVAKIIFILNELPLTELEDLLKLYITDVVEMDEVAFRKKELILDILPTLGRVDIVPLIRTLLRDDVIGSIRTIYMLNKLMVTATPSILLPTDLLDLLEEPVVQEDIALKKAVMLTLGTLIHKTSNLLKQLHLEDSMHQIAERIEREFERSTTDVEKLAWIKTIGNAGLTKLLPLLERCILDTTLSPLIREKAIYSLRRMAPLLKRKIQSLCLPVYLNPEEPVKMRVAAFLMTMKTEPSCSVLQLVAHSLTKEPTLNIATFVYTYLEELTKVEPLPHLSNMTLHLKTIMKTLPPIRAGLIYSRSLRLEMMYKLINNFGLDAELHLLNDGTSYIPESLVARFSTRMLGSKIEMLELGLESAGLTTLLHHLGVRESILTDILEGRISLEELLHPFRSPAVYQHIQEIAEKLFMAERPLEVLDLSLYAKLFGNEIAFFNLDKEFVEELFTLVRESLPELMSILKSGRQMSWLETLATVNSDVIVPTASGLPLSLNATLVTVASVKGNVHLTGIHTLLDLLTPSTLGEIKLIPDIKISMITEMAGKMCLHIPYFKFVTELKTQYTANLPLKTELSLNLPEKKIKFTYDIPETDVTLFEYKMLPLTKVIKILKTPTSQLFCTEEIKEFTLHDYIIPDTTELLAGETLLGVPVKLTIMRQTTTVPELERLTMFWTEHIVKVELIKSTIVPTQLELELTLLDHELLTNTAFNIFGERTEEVAYRSLPYRSPLVLTFDPVTPDAILVNPKIIKLLLTLKPIGGNLQKEMKLQLTYLMDAHYRNHQLNLQLLTTPLLAEATSPIKIMLETVFMIPEPLWLAQPLNEKSLMLATTLKYGFTNTLTEAINLQMFVGPVPDTEILLRTDTPVLTPQLRQQFSQILIEPSLFHHLRPVLPEIAPTATDTPTYTPIALSMEITLNGELPVCPYSYLQKTYVLALRLLPMDPIPNVLQVLNTPNKLEVIAVLVPTKMMIMALLPTETLILKPIPLPLSFLFPVDRRTTPISHLLYLTQQEPLPAGVCKVENEELTTFDFLTYPIPEYPGCETLLSQDCTPRKQFAITMKKVTGSNKKIVTLYLGNDIVELIPTSGSWFSHAGHHIKVNGFEVTVPAARPYIHTCTQTSTELFRIVKEGERLRISSLLAPTVVTDLIDIIIQEGDLFRGQLCGLCGDFNSDRTDDLTGPRMRVHETPAELVASYLIPSDTCPAEPATEPQI